jgi:tetratricopeptide (TPR) repeat protein
MNAHYEKATAQLIQNYALEKLDIDNFLKRLNNFGVIDQEILGRTRKHICKSMENNQKNGGNNTKTLLPVMNIERQNAKLTQSEIQIEKQKSYLFFKLTELFFNTSLKSNQTIYGKSHVITLSSMNNLAVLYLCQMLDALDVFQNHLCFPYYDAWKTFLEKEKLAESLYKECLELRITILGRHHVDTLSSMSNLGLFYEAQQNYNLSESVYKECLELRRTILGNSHLTTITSMYRLAIVYQTLKKYDLAKSLYEECLEHRSKISGDAQPNTILLMKHLTILKNIIKKFSHELFFSFPREIIFRILNYTNKNEFGRLDHSLTNHHIRERWIPIKKPFFQLFRKIIICNHTLRGHSHIIYAVIELMDGRIVSCSEDKTIKIWNLTDYSCEQTLTGHKRGVYSLVTLPDGRIASGSGDKTIKIWNIGSSTCEKTLRGHGDSIVALILLADGRLASGSDDSSIKIWNLQNYSCERTLSFSSNEYRFVYSFIQLKDGRIMSGSGDNTTKIWNIENGVCERTIPGSDFIVALTQLDDGRIVSATRFGILIDIWNIETGMNEKRLSGHLRDIHSIIRLDHSRIASGSQDKTIKVWNIAKESTNEWGDSCEWTLNGHSDWVSTALIRLKDGRIVSGSADKTIKIWSLFT